MFSIESALVKKTLLKWFNREFKRQFNKINPIKKLRYESKNPINWKEDKCVICTFPIKLKPTNFETPDNEMSFGDFVIRYEHKFLINICTEEQIKDSHHVKYFKSYYKIFEEYILICIGLLALLNNFNRNDFINSATEKFVEDKFAGDEISEIKNNINKTETKNALSTTHRNVPNFNLKIYAHVYDELVCFPRSDIDYETITTNKFFTNVHQLIRGKLHLYHSHITRKIFGYAYDFCNTILVEKSTPEIHFVACNLFGFDLFYCMKAYIASAWCSKELNIGGTNST